MWVLVSFPCFVAKFQTRFSRNHASEGTYVWRGVSRSILIGSVWILDRWKGLFLHFLALFLKRQNGTKCPTLACRVTYAHTILVDDYFGKFGLQDQRQTHLSFCYLSFPTGVVWEGVGTGKETWAKVILRELHGVSMAPRTAQHDKFCSEIF